MKKATLFFALLALLSSACNQVQDAKEKSKDAVKETTVNAVESNALTDDEKTAGFKRLFNGINTEGWHPYKNTRDSTYKWEIKDGILSTKGGHVDLVSDSTFENFELRFDWKVGKSGNSGIMYMVQENEPKTDATWNTGVEYQIIDHKGWPDQLHESQKAGAVYDMYDPLVMAANEAGEWNTAKIISNKGHVEHYLNGQKTGEYDWNSKDFKARVAKSKFKAMPYGKKIKGQFALQDHGQAVAFKNVRIKML